MEDTNTPNTEGQQVENQNQNQGNQNQPFAIFPDAASFKARVDREAAKQQKELLKSLGFDSIEAMKAALSKQNQQGGEQQQEPQVNEAQRYQMALQVAVDMNLPAVLISRLQGNTVDDLRADAEKLQALFQNVQSKAGIPNAPAGQSKPITFTRAQLQDPAFVRANKDAIMQAAREGRIQ